jgi:hypothetical protein
MVFNEMPSFSPDGKRIIFARSATKRTFTMNAIERPSEIRPSQWDIYEMDIATGKECRLTNYGFSRISRPYYFADGKRFIFSELNILRLQEESGIDVGIWREFDEKHRFNTIFIMDGERNDLKPAFTNGSWSKEPKLGWNDTVLFKSLISKRGPNHYYDLFTYKNGKVTRIFNEQLHLSFNSHYISPDGTLFLLDWIIFDMDGKKYNKIKIPWQQLEKP